MVEELKYAPKYRAFKHEGDSSIFDDICKLQQLILMESELKQTFFQRFDTMI